MSHLIVYWITLKTVPSRLLKTTVLFAYAGLAYIVMIYIVMVYAGMAYIVMACIVMAF